MMTENKPKNAAEHKCEKCDFKCFKKSNYNLHLLTAKHRMMTNDDAKMPKISSPYACGCGKQYKYRQGLHAHKLKCDKLSTRPDSERLVLDLMIQNKELMDLLVSQNNEHKDFMKIVTIANPVSVNTNNTINNNQKFNINLFLNDQCKDAINFADFIKNIEISHQDLENNAQLGFVNGISKIFMDNLKQLGVNERPIHCTDAKRETMYIKDEDKWTKEPDDSKLQKAIQTVSYKSMGKLQEWKQENPEYQNVDSDFSKKCLDMHKNTLAGSDREVYYPKVIHVLAKETMVDK
jgi:hypothetical protein